MALFKNFIEPGRLAIGRYGCVTDKAVIIVDIVDLNRVIVVVPEASKRVLIPIKRLQMTDYKVELARGASVEDVEGALKENDVVSEWKKTSWGKRTTAFYAKRALTDLERFKVVRAQKYVDAQM
ncbi:putative 60S ribosomal protein L14 [Gregarina niphandrodes]|uniref:60S ribosomal protein L14 n=1 Tax=Gregarina niphandrodes TaxID=110365 RepID=A0A023B3L1_GRENI|nr:putative 60S ribosomal protein L14 [Gregarina niphandrodes]EZG55424.1 putative 60S ribosomal protein L14 [Gregarina niphandrodes]|eukprot:XP_011131564.1 putative 60S ribosomal protein L14 [Gregarina niphandrodes]